MIDETFEFVRGSGNVYRDLRKENPDVRQLKALLAAEIIRWLDREGMTAKDAAILARVPAADLSRIRNASLDRFTVDRLIEVIGRLGSRVDVTVKLRRRRRSRKAAA